MGGRRCEVYVCSHGDIHWQASATNDDGWLGIPTIRLKKARYPTLQEAGARAIKHYQAGK